MSAICFIIVQLMHGAYLQPIKSQLLFCHKILWVVDSQIQNAVIMEKLISIHVIFFKCRNHCELSISWISLCFIYLYFFSMETLKLVFETGIPASQGRQL